MAAPIRRAPARWVGLFFDIVSGKRDAQAAAPGWVLVKCVSWEEAKLRFVSALSLAVFLFFGRGGWQGEPESLILAQNERWRHA